MTDLTPDQQLTLARALLPARRWRVSAYGKLFFEKRSAQAFSCGGERVRGERFDLTSPEAIGLMVALVLSHKPLLSIDAASDIPACFAFDAGVPCEGYGNDYRTALARLALAVLEQENTDG